MGLSAIVASESEARMQPSQSEIVLPDTVTALFSWALGTRSEQVALAPVSAR